MLLAIDKLRWDYTCSAGQIRPLSDSHVAEVRTSIAAVPPKSHVQVVVVPADAVGVCAPSPLPSPFV